MREDSPKNHKKKKSNNELVMKSRKLGISFSREDLLNTKEIDSVQKKINEFKEKKKKIDSIYLNGNQLEKFEEEDFEKLRRISDNNLKLLDLSKNIISTIAIPIDLTTILTLDLSYNRLKIIPSEICTMTHLKNLYVQKNSISKIPTSISKLLYLKRFNCSENLLALVPIQLRQCISLKSVNFKHNPLIDPPYQICKKGWKSIISFWRSNKKMKEGDNNSNKEIDTNIFSSLSICKSRFTAKNQREIDEYQLSIQNEDSVKELELENILKSNASSKNFYEYLCTQKKPKYLLFFEKISFYEKTFSIEFRNKPSNFVSNILKNDEEESLPPILFHSSPENCILDMEPNQETIGISLESDLMFPQDLFMGGGDNNTNEMFTSDASGMFLDVPPKRESSKNEMSRNVANQIFEEFISEKNPLSLSFPFEVTYSVGVKIEKDEISFELFDRAKKHSFDIMKDFIIPYKSSSFYSRGRKQNKFII